MAAWVAAADTKLGLLAAALTVLTGAVLSQERVAWHVLFKHPDSLRVAACALLGVSLVTLVLAVTQLVQGLRARMPVEAPNRFSFPHVAGMPLEDLVALDPSGARRDAWMQARALAAIVKRKYTAFNRALLSAAVAGAFLALWFVIPSSGGA